MDAEFDEKEPSEMHFSSYVASEKTHKSKLQRMKPIYQQRSQVASLSKEDTP